MNNKYIKGRGASINYLYKKLRCVHATQEKKSVCLAVRIYPSPHAYSSRGKPQKYFSTFNQELL